MGHWLVIDLEATTDDGGWPITDMEVIEIGASLVNREGREVDHFQRFVRPRRRPQLTTFCRELTHISQASVDSAAPFNEVWAQFERWLGEAIEAQVPEPNAMTVATVGASGPAGAYSQGTSSSEWYHWSQPGRR